MLDIAAYLARITEYQTEITPNSQALPVLVYSQSDYPYWLNRVQSITPVRVGIGAFNFRYDITIESWLVRGHYVEGEDTQLERVCQSDVYTVLSKFLANPTLKTASYETVPTGFYPGSLNIQCSGVGLIDATSMGSSYLITFSHIEQEFNKL